MNRVLADFPAAAGVAFVAAAACLTQLRLWSVARRGCGTTLRPALACLAPVHAAWCFAWIVHQMRIDNGDSPLPAAGWYVLSVAALVPAALVLGARRPINRAWPLFVVLPMAVVLTWPAVLGTVGPWLFGSSGGGDTFTLEVPQAVGFGLVLLMGAGNYAGTRFTASATCYTAAVLGPGLLVPRYGAGWNAEIIAHLPSLSLVLFAIALFIAERASDSPNLPTAPELAPRYTRLWIDVRDRFGLVWAKRLLDRLNLVAEKEAWTARVDLSGVVQQKDAVSRSLTDAEHARIEHHLRWLLRRFVTPEWIDARLPPLTPITVDQPAEAQEATDEPSDE